MTAELTLLWMNLRLRWHCPRSGYVSVLGSRLYQLSSVQCRSCRAMTSSDTQTREEAGMSRTVHHLEFYYNVPQKVVGALLLLGFFDHPEEKRFNRWVLDQELSWVCRSGSVVPLQAVEVGFDLLQLLAQRHLLIFVPARGNQGNVTERKKVTAEAEAFLTTSPGGNWLPLSSETL